MNTTLFNALDLLNMRGAVTPHELATASNDDALRYLLRERFAETIAIDGIGELIIPTKQGCAAYEAATLIV